MRTARGITSGPIVAAVVLLLTGCAAEITPPAVTGGTAAICRALVADLPATVDGQAERTVRPRSDLTAAWGHPAITLACGVAKPAGMNAASRCWEVNGVGWYAEERDSDVRYTTLGRKALVQVTVPNKFTPQAAALVDLAGPIKDHVPVLRSCV